MFQEKVGNTNSGVTIMSPQNVTGAPLASISIISYFEIAKPWFFGPIKTICL